MGNREPKVHVIDGVTYVEVDRKAKVGDKIYSDVTGKIYTVKAIRGNLAVVARSVGHIHGFFHDDYVVLAEVGEEPTVDESQASEQVIEMLANLARRVTSLERQLADTQRNLERHAEELENAKHRISKHATMFGAVEEKVEMLTDDIVTLDERTQVVNAITKFYEEGGR